MLLTKTLIKFNNLLVKIPSQTKRVWDLAENRWGYKKSKKIKYLYLEYLLEMVILISPFLLFIERSFFNLII